MSLYINRTSDQVLLVTACTYTANHCEQESSRATNPNVIYNWTMAADMFRETVQTLREVECPNSSDTFGRIVCGTSELTWILYRALVFALGNVSLMELAAGHAEEACRQRAQYEDVLAIITGELVEHAQCEVQ